MYQSSAHWAPWDLRDQIDFNKNVFKHEIQLEQLTKQVQDNKRIEMYENSTLSSLFKATKENRTLSTQLVQQQRWPQGIRTLPTWGIKKILSYLLQSFNISMCNVHIQSGLVS